MGDAPPPAPAHLHFYLLIPCSDENHTPSPAQPLQTPYKCRPRAHTPRQWSKSPHPPPPLLPLPLPPHLQVSYIHCSRCRRAAVAFPCTSPLIKVEEASAWAMPPAPAPTPLAPSNSPPLTLVDRTLPQRPHLQVSYNHSSLYWRHPLDKGRRGLGSGQCPLPPQTHAPLSLHLPPRPSYFVSVPPQANPLTCRSRATTLTAAVVFTGVTPLIKVEEASAVGDAPGT